MEFITIIKDLEYSMWGESLIFNAIKSTIIHTIKFLFSLCRAFKSTTTISQLMVLISFNIEFENNAFEKGECSILKHNSLVLRISFRFTPKSCAI